MFLHIHNSGIYAISYAYLKCVFFVNHKVAFIWRDLTNYCFPPSKVFDNSDVSLWSKKPRAPETELSTTTTTTRKTCPCFCQKQESLTEKKPGIIKGTCPSQLFLRTHLHKRWTALFPENKVNLISKDKDIHVKNVFFSYTTGIYESYIL